MKVLELFAGIGGCAAAVEGRHRVACAVDHDEWAARVYRSSFPDHPHQRWNLASVRPDRLAAFDADLWWMSPPCQPFTVRGKRRDMDDPRCAGLIRLTECIAEVRPRWVALENVPGFETSRMRDHLLRTLGAAGYHWRERQLCPTRLGIPMRRNRYYLLASTGFVPDWRPLRPHPRRVEGFLDPAPDHQLQLEDELLERFAGNLPISDPVAAPWVGVFTAAYGKSPVYAGSYWRGPGGVRRFSPTEILRFLGFGDRVRFPPEVDERRAYKLVGNSLSVDAVREVLAHVHQADADPPYST